MCNFLDIKTNGNAVCAEISGPEVLERHLKSKTLVELFDTSIARGCYQAYAQASGLQKYSRPRSKHNSTLKEFISTVLNEAEKKKLKDVRTILSQGGIKAELIFD